MRITMERSDTAKSMKRILAVIAVIIVSFAACAKDIAGPINDLRFNKEIANLQDENLVPNSLVEADPTCPIEPIGNTYVAIDDDLPTEDGDYAWRNRLGLPPTYCHVIVGLTDPTGGTPGASQRHTLKVKYMVWGNYSSASPQPTLLFYELLQGSTPIAQKTVFPNGSNWVIDSVSWTGPGSITNYNDLNIRLSLQLKPISDGNDQIQGRVAWARLEIR